MFKSHSSKPDRKFCDSWAKAQEGGTQVTQLVIEQGVQESKKGDWNRKRMEQAGTLILKQPSRPSGRVREKERTQKLAAKARDVNAGHFQVRPVP